MLKILLSKWGIFTIAAIISIATAVTIALVLPTVEDIEIVSTKAEYVLVNEAGDRIYNQKFQITNSDLENGVYTNKIYLKKISKENAYLRMFVSISKKTDDGVVSVDDYNVTIPYQVSFIEFIDGDAIDDFDSDFSTDVNFCWKYYNQKVKTDEVKLFDSIIFENGIEEGCSYIINISQIEMVNESDIQSSNWQYDVISRIQLAN